MKNFKNRILDGEIFNIEEELKDAIERWHTSKADQAIELSEYLGLSTKEYFMFVEDYVEFMKYLKNL